MRDGLPAEARAQTELVRRIIGSFELHGYELVNVPMFEYAEVLERGLGALELSEVLRFVEPETGAVVALRPDMTPQVARLLATRLADAPLPARLCYQGSVLRRRRERASSSSAPPGSRAISRFSPSRRARFERPGSPSS
jgi:ATP phosphoribosyltransferase regulatory subunit